MLILRFLVGGPTSLAKNKCTGLLRGRAPIQSQHFKRKVEALSGRASVLFFEPRWHDGRNPEDLISDCTVRRDPTFLIRQCVRSHPGRNPSGRFHRRGNVRWRITQMPERFAHA